MKKEKAQSIGLRRCRVVEFSSKASAKTRLGLAISGAGNTTLFFGLPPRYTSSRNRFWSVNMMPPKNMLLAESFQRMTKWKNPLEADSKKFLFARTRRGVCYRF